MQKMDVLWIESYTISMQEKYRKGNRWNSTHLSLHRSLASSTTHNINPNGTRRQNTQLLCWAGNRFRWWSGIIWVLDTIAIFHFALLCHLYSTSSLFKVEQSAAASFLGAFNITQLRLPAPVPLLLATTLCVHSLYWRLCNVWSVHLHSDSRI